MRDSYWLFGKQAVYYFVEYRDDKTPKQLAKKIAKDMDYCVYEFDPSLEYSAHELLSVAMGWESYLEIDEELYALLCHEEEGNNEEFKQTKQT